MLFGDKDVHAPQTIASKNQVRAKISHVIDTYFSFVSRDLDWSDKIFPSVRVEKVSCAIAFCDRNFQPDSSDMGLEGEPIKDYTKIVIRVGELDSGERHDYLADAAISLMQEAQASLANGRISERVNITAHGVESGSLSVMPGVSTLKIDESDGGVTCTLKVDSAYMDKIEKTFDAVAENLVVEAVMPESAKVVGRPVSKTVLFA